MEGRDEACAPQPISFYLMSFEPLKSYFDDDEDALPLPLTAEVVIANWKTASAAASLN
jgi:hypothetical protein